MSDITPEALAKIIDPAACDDWDCLPDTPGLDERKISLLVRDRNLALTKARSIQALYAERMKELTDTALILSEYREALELCGTNLLAAEARAERLAEALRKVDAEVEEYAAEAHLTGLGAYAACEAVRGLAITALSEDQHHGR